MARLIADASPEARWRRGLREEIVGELVEVEMPPIITAPATR